MVKTSNSILLLGESNVGKTHYGAQLLKRLIKADGRLRMDKAPTNMKPFEDAMHRLDEGLAASHTTASTYLDSLWPLVDLDGRVGELVWPDYGGEQLKNIIETRRLPIGWKERIKNADTWLLMVRINKMRVHDDVFSRPLEKLQNPNPDSTMQMSDQARMIELLQMLLHIRGEFSEAQLTAPRLGVLLTCWDELTEMGKPSEIFRTQLPLLSDFVWSNWADPLVLGLSALGRSLDPQRCDEDYVTGGPDQFGYVVTADGQKTSDLTIPIEMLLSSHA